MQHNDGPAGPAMSSRDCFNRTSFFCFVLLVFCLHVFLKREGVTQLCITCFVAQTCITILHVTETLTLLSSFNSQLHILTSLRL